MLTENQVWLILGKAWAYEKWNEVIIKVCNSRKL